MNTRHRWILYPTTVHAPPSWEIGGDRLVCQQDVHESVNHGCMTSGCFPTRLAPSKDAGMEADGDLQTHEAGTAATLLDEEEAEAEEQRYRSTGPAWWTAEEMHERSEGLW